MIPSTGLGITLGNSENEIENKDPFVVTPPRKHDSAQHTASTTPTTPKSRSTPLHKRFLEEVTMSPGTTSTPPRTPTRSPKRGQTPKQTLEVGQNGFYFSMEIPEKKITPRKAATPDAKVTGRLTPSPDKQKRSEVKVGGRVKDILRKNLFGTSTKHVLQAGKEGRETQTLYKADGKDGWSPSKFVRVQSNSSEGGESSKAQQGAGKEATTEPVSLPVAAQNLPTPSQSSTAPPSTVLPLTKEHTDMTQEQSQTPRMIPAPAPTSHDISTAHQQKPSAASTPSNIGHLMANHSNSGSKVQMLPETGGLESMPTPLRKMSERLGLRSPNIVRKSKINESEGVTSTAASQEQMLKQPISVLDLQSAAAMTNGSAGIAATGEGAIKTTLSTLQRVRSEHRLHKPLPSPITTAFPFVPSRPSTATTPQTSSPSTPSRPGLGNRAKSFGTPSRLRSSMQEDMFKMQESLKRSLGPEVFQTNVSKPSTPMSMSPSLVPVEATLSVTRQMNGSPKKSARPISMIGPPKAQEVTATDTVRRRPNATGSKPRPKSMFGPPSSTGAKSTATMKNVKLTSVTAAPKADETTGTDTVIRRRLNTAERKPRPKSMIAGSAKMLETIASQIDSPRERAKLRSAAAPSSTRHTGPTTSRPGTVTSISRPQSAATRSQGSKPQPTAHNTKPVPPRPTTQPKRAAPPTSSPHPAQTKQRPASTTVLGPQKATDRTTTAPLPLACRPIKAQTQSKTVPIRGRPRALKTPEPEARDLKKDSGTAQSYTPPGQPTRLPSPVKEVSRTRLVVGPSIPAACGVAKADAPALTKEKTEVATTKQATEASKIEVKPVHSEAKVAHTPFPKRLVSGDASSLRTPSKEVQSALDAAIDRKIREDRERIGAGWL